MSIWQGTIRHYSDNQCSESRVTQRQAGQSESRSGAQMAEVKSLLQRQMRHLRDAFGMDASERVLALAATELNMSVVPTLYDALLLTGNSVKLHVVLHCQGGDIHSARRIALLLREFVSNVTFWVPHYCTGAGTVLALSGNTVMAGPMSVFSPVQPVTQLQELSSGRYYPASLNELKSLPQLMVDLYGIREADAKIQVAKQLTEKVFPSELASVYREAKQVSIILEELLATSHPMMDSKDARKVINALMCGYYSNQYAITADELTELGLNVKSGIPMAGELWAMAKCIESTIGNASRVNSEGEWCDALVVSDKYCGLRLSNREQMSSQWVVED